MGSFAENLAKYRNTRAAHHDTSEKIPWSSDAMQHAYCVLRVIMRFHFLNLFQRDHKELNKKLAKRIWQITKELPESGQ